MCLYCLEVPKYNVIQMKVRHRILVHTVHTVCHTVHIRLIKYTSQSVISQQTVRAA